MPPAERVHASGTPVLTVSEVAVHFGGVAALSDASLTVEPGSVTGLIGPNGAGKTTLFNVISGLQAPDRGTVRLFDTDVTRMRPHRRARLGLARTFQRLELFGSLSAGENVQVGLESSVKWWQWGHIKRAVPWVRRGGAGDARAEDEPTGPGSLAVRTSDRLLSGVGLGGLGSRQASAMPTGLARMVELARALALGPKLLLLDEPGSGLDEAECQTLGELLTTLARGGMGVLLVEHDMELVMRICDYIYVLDFGDIIAAGTSGGDPQRPEGPGRLSGRGGRARRGRHPGHGARGRAPGPTGRRGCGRGGRVMAGPVTSTDGGASTTTLPASITIRGVRAAYGRIEVLHGVDLEVPAGGVFALLGPNGAGKSTLLRVISGLMRPTGGEVLIGGEPTGKTPTEKLVRRGICAVPEGRGIFPNLTVRENLRIWTYGGDLEREGRRGADLRDLPEAPRAAAADGRHPLGR